MATEQNGEIHFAPGEVNPLDKDAAKDLRAQTIASSYEKPQDLAGLEDLQEGKISLMGMQARPLGAAVIAILESLDHPLVRGGAPDGEQEMSIIEMLAICYCVFCPDDDRLYADALKGRDHFYIQAMKFGQQWDFRWLQEAIEEIMAKIAAAGDAAETYLGGPDSEKK